MAQVPVLGDRPVAGPSCRARAGVSLWFLAVPSFPVAFSMSLPERLRGALVEMLRDDVMPPLSSMVAAAIATAVADYDAAADDDEVEVVKFLFANEITHMPPQDVNRMYGFLLTVAERRRSRNAEESYTRKSSIEAILSRPHSPSWCKALAPFDPREYGASYLMVEKHDVLQYASGCREDQGWVKVKRCVRKNEWVRSTGTSRETWEEKSSGWVPGAFVKRIGTDVPGFRCTGQCGRAWSAKDEVSAWSKAQRPYKPWCYHCGRWHKGQWNNHGMGYPANWLTSGVADRSETEGSEADLGEWL